MANWVQKETCLDFNPYYYECTLGDFSICLGVAYKSGPWTVRLYKKGGTMIKEHFILEKHDLDTAKDEAFNIVSEILQKEIKYWTYVSSIVDEMMNANG